MSVISSRKDQVSTEFVAQRYAVIPHAIPDDGGAGTDVSERSVATVPGDSADTYDVTEVNVQFDGSVTANDTNFATVTLYKRNADGTSQTKLAEQTTKTSGSGGTGDLSAFEAFTLSISTAAITGGQSLTMEVTKSGTGVDLARGTMAIEYVAT